MANGWFVFDGYDYSFRRGQAVFHYEVKSKYGIRRFQETLRFPPIKKLTSAGEIIARRILDNLLLILGISYWKTGCARNMEIRPFALTKKQAKFWNKVYTKGLGEFYYKNKIDFRGLINFPYSMSQAKLTPTWRKLSLRHLRESSLLMLGGGKDSIVAGELLRKKGKPFDLYILNPVSLQKKVGRMLGGNIISVKRILDPQLRRLNTDGAYNGHVPVSAIYAFTGLAAAALYGYKHVVAANEKSANYGNLKYLRGMVNHQWSKSAEFEKLFKQYVREFITPDITYYSLLRPYGELEIAEIFSKYPRYFGAFSSCNTNFRISRLFQAKPGTKWCGKCPKCAFTFAALAAFIPKSEVVKIFGKNLLADKTLVPVYEELLGIRRHKPFDCVGTPDETAKAFAIISKRGEFDEDFIIKPYRTKFPIVET